jgi:hypothetical protein
MSESWIDDILAEHTTTVETPESWIYWSLMFVISSAAANAYTVKSFGGKVTYYPNIYVMLLGDSGVGKGYPVNLAKRLLQEADITRVIAGRSSIQAIIKEGATTKSVAGKAVITDSRMAIVNGELSSAVIGDPQALEILTDLFDRNYNPNWTNMLKGDGHEKLKEPYVTCLFGSSPAHFYNSIPQHNIEGGYVGRNLIIYEEKRARIIDSLDSEDKVTDVDWFIDIAIPKYIPHLVKIAKNKARLILEEPARLLYNSWKAEWRATESKYQDKTGFVTRVPDHALKVAMCLSLSRYNSNFLIIESDIIQAISNVTGLIYASAKAAEGGGLDPLAAQTKRVVDALIAAPDNILTRQELLVRGYGDYDNITLDKIIDTLMEMKWCVRQKTLNNKDWIYSLAGEPKESLMRFRQGKK